MNQAQPVQPYVIDFIHREHRKVADTAVKLLMGHNPNRAKELFRNPPTTPHAPHIKASQLANALVKWSFVARHEGRSPEELNDERLRINKVLATRSASSWPQARLGKSNRHWQKARRNNLYLAGGMAKSSRDDDGIPAAAAAAAAVVAAALAAAVAALAAAEVVAAVVTAAAALQA